MDTGKERKRIKAWEQKICFLHLKECMIPTENISLTHEHYDLCVLPRPRSQPCWYLHVEFRTNLGNKMAPQIGSRPPLITVSTTIIHIMDETKYYSQWRPTTAFFLSHKVYPINSVYWWCCGRFAAYKITWCSCCVCVPDLNRVVGSESFSSFSLPIESTIP